MEKAWKKTKAFFNWWTAPRLFCYWVGYGLGAGIDNPGGWLWALIVTMIIGSGLYSFTEWGKQARKQAGER